MDKGVFGLFKFKWYFIIRKYIRENLDKVIGKENFVVKLLEIFLYFYKLLIVINVFKLVGIYFVDSIVIIYEMLKFLLIYIDKVVNECVEVENEISISS